MANAHPKIALSVSRDIPFNKLVLSQANVRRIKAGIAIEELAEDIARRTLLQSLTVRPVLDDGGTETGLYEVPAGGRRYRALELLVKKKRLTRTAPIPCIVRTDGIPEEDSLAENVQQAPLHPLDQFRAFLSGTNKGAAGRWIDFATGEHGHVLDLIARTQRLVAFRDVLDEVRRLLSLPEPSEAYLRRRGITDTHNLTALRFHPRRWYRAHDNAPRETWPALIAAVTNLNGQITGVQRTWLARDGSGKAPLATPRRAMGQLAGHGVRLGVPIDVMATGEGLETMLALRQVLPAMPMVAALSATHLAMLILPPSLRRLYVALDNDRAGHHAADKLAARARTDGIEAVLLTPSTDDFNTDLSSLGREVLMAPLRAQLAPEDVGRFLGVERRSDLRPCRLSVPSGPSSPSVAPGLHEGDRARSGRGPQRLRVAFFPWRRLSSAAIPRETRKPCSPSSACAPALQASPLGAGLSPFRRGDRQKAAIGAASTREDQTHDDRSHHRRRCVSDRPSARRARALRPPAL